MSDYEFSGDETSGDENVVGALASNFRRAGMPAANARTMAKSIAPMVGRPALSTRGISPKKDVVQSYCGMGTVSWTGTDAADKQMEVEPQQSFKGERLVITARYSSGATGRLVTINRPLTVAGLPQTPAPDQETPIEMFAADCTYAKLDLQVADAGTKISMALGIDQAPGSGESVVVAAGLYGIWIQG